MTAFDLAEVRKFTKELDASLARCDNGEGMECANLDDTLRHYATQSYEFCEQVRQWGRAVFTGRAAFDPEVERVFHAVAIRLHSRASELLAYGQEAESGPCYVLEGRRALGLAVWRLERLLTGWVTPKLAVAPLARQGIALASDTSEAVRKRIEALPPLPANWEPANARQRILFAKLRKKPTS